MTVIQCLELSTAHITEATANAWPTREDFPLVANYEYGMFVHVPPPDDDERLDKLPCDLRVVIEYARERGCTLIRFDKDAYAVEGLSVFDW